MYAEATKPRGKGPVTETVEEQHEGTGFSFYYEVSVHAPRSKYTYASDLPSAEVEGFGRDQRQRQLLRQPGDQRAVTRSAER